MEGRVEWKMDKTVKSQAATSGTEDSSTTLWPPLSMVRCNLNPVEKRVTAPRFAAVCRDATS